MGPPYFCLLSTLMLSKSDTRGSAMSGIAGFMSCSFMKLIYQKFSCISVLSQAELGMQLKTQLNWDQNCIFTEWNELDVRSAMFGMAEFWVSDFESICVFWTFLGFLISLTNKTDANKIWDQVKQNSGFVILSWFSDFTLLTIPL